MVLSKDAQNLMKVLVMPISEPILHPILVIVGGLPGTGKSFFSQRVTERIPMVILESDFLRKTLVQAPVYTAEESTRLFLAIHETIDALLAHSLPVLLDATSLAKANREPLYQIAARHGAKVVMVRMVAPPEIVYQRLEARANRKRRQGHSDADWGIYERMLPFQEPLKLDHLVVDTSREIGPPVEKVVLEINKWIKQVQ